MNKYTEEVEKLFNQLIIDQNKLNKTIALVSISNNKVSNSVYDKTLENLTDVIFDANTCLDYLLSNLENLDKGIIDISKKYLDNVLDEFNEALNLIEEINPNPETYTEYTRALYHDIALLNEKFLNIDRNIEVRVLNGQEKLLHKNLQGQLKYINKILNDPENFTPKNSKNTLKKANNITLILKQLRAIVASTNNSNSTYFIELFNEVTQKSDDLRKKLSNIEQNQAHNLNNKSVVRGTKDLRKKIEKTNERQQHAHDTINAKAKLLNRLVDSSNRYTTVRDKTDQPIEDDQYDAMNMKVGTILNKTTYELINFDFNNITTDLHQILEEGLKDINILNINDHKNTLFQINEAVDTLKANWVMYSDNSIELYNLTDPSIKECIQHNMNRTINALTEKIKSFSQKIIQIEKSNETVSKITEAVAESQNSLNDIWRQRSTLSTSRKQEIIDQNISNIFDALSHLIENKKTMITTPEGRELSAALLSKIDNSVDQLILAIPDKNLRKAYANTYDKIVKNRFQSKESLPRWTTIKPSMATEPNKQATPPSSDSEKIP